MFQYKQYYTPCSVQCSECTVYNVHELCIRITIHNVNLFIYQLMIHIENEAYIS